MYNKIKIKNNHKFIEQVFNKYQEIKEIGNYRVNVQNKEVKNNSYTNYADTKDSWITCTQGKIREQLIGNSGTEVKYAAIIDNCKITLNIENDYEKYGRTIYNFWF